MRTDLRDNAHQVLTGLYNIIRDLDSNSNSTKGKEGTKNEEKGKNETGKMIERMMNEREEWKKGKEE
jgi:hypothetical protein